VQMVPLCVTPAHFTTKHGSNGISDILKNELRTNP
jgi:hypothetical protein